MKPEKLAAVFINWLLGAFFAFGILVFLEQFGNAGWVWYSHSLRCWPVLLCFAFGLAGRALPGLKYLLMALSAAVAALAPALLIGSLGFLDVLYLLAVAVLGEALFFLGLRGEEAFPGKLAVASLLVYLGSCAYFLLGDYALADFEPVCWCGLVSFLLALYSFNGASLYTGVHNAKGGETMAIPAGIRGKNLLLLTGFLLAAMLIGNLPLLHRLLDGMWHWVLHCVGVFLNFLANLQGGGGDPPAAASPTPADAPSNFDIVQIENTGSGTFVAVYGVLLGICALVFFLLAYGFAREGRGGGVLRRLSDALRRLFQTRQILEYEDDVEKLTDLKTLLRERRKGLRRFWEKLKTRPERFEDMPDDRMRVRFAYKTLLKSGRVAGWTPSSTPAEVGAALTTESLRDLTARYNAARYDTARPLPPEAAEAAKEALRALGKRSGA